MSNIHKYMVHCLIPIIKLNLSVYMFKAMNITKDRRRLPRGTSLIGISVRDFFRTKGFKRIFDGFFFKTKGFLPKMYEIFGSEMPLGDYSAAEHDSKRFDRWCCALQHCS